MLTDDHGADLETEQIWRAESVVKKVEAFIECKATALGCNIVLAQYCLESFLHLSYVGVEGTVWQCL